MKHRIRAQSVRGVRCVHGVSTVSAVSFIISVVSLVYISTVYTAHPEVTPQIAQSIWDEVQGRNEGQYVLYGPSALTP
jgi:hypothetical protein